jgi:ABC-2 type transport system ATP-binding protein
MLDEHRQREIVIEAVGLTKRYEAGPPAVRNLSFTVSRGEVYCLLGGKSAGKTTTVDIVLGLQAPTSGTIIVAGFDPSERPIESRRLMSFIDGVADFYPSMTPLENLRFFLRMCGGAGKLTLDRVDANALREVGMADRDIHTKIAHLGGDASVATALAIGLIRASPIVVMDDPTARLDSRAIARLEDTLDLFRQRQTAVLLTTHDVSLAGQVADRVGILKQGEKITERSRSALVGQSLTEFIELYVGRQTRLPETGASMRRS